MQLIRIGITDGRQSLLWRERYNAVISVALDISSLLVPAHTTGLD